MFLILKMYSHNVSSHINTNGDQEREVETTFRGRLVRLHWTLKEGKNRWAVYKGSILNKDMEGNMYMSKEPWIHLLAGVKGSA